MSENDKILDDEYDADAGNEVSEQPKRKKGRKKKPADWTAIRAEYIAGEMSLAQLAEKYGVTKSAIQKKSAAGRWSDKRRQKSDEKSDKIAERLTEYSAKQKVKDISKACNAASALIDKIIEATDELRKIELFNKKVTKTHKTKNQDGDITEIDTTETTFDYEITDGMIDTKKLSFLSKSLANCKAVLEVAENDNDDEIGVIEMPAMTVLEPPEEEAEVLNSG